jgi:hypothetical protein
MIDPVSPGIEMLERGFERFSGKDVLDGLGKHY